MKRSKITLQSGKTYTYSGTDGAYTVILGELAAGDAPASSGSAAMRSSFGSATRCPAVEAKAERSHGSESKLTYTFTSS
jgi:hypothetical protein